MRFTNVLGLPFIFIITADGKEDLARGEKLRDELMESLHSSSTNMEFWQPSCLHVLDLTDDRAYHRMFESIMISLGLKKVGVFPEPIGDFIDIGPLDAKQQIAALQGELSVSRSQLQAVKGDREHETMILADMYKSNTVKASELQHAKEETAELKRKLEKLVSETSNFVNKHVSKSGEGAQDITSGNHETEELGQLLSQLTHFLRGGGETTRQSISI